MTSRRHDAPTAALWRWLAEHDPVLEGLAEDRESLAAIDQRVRAIDPGLGWEVGPHGEGRFFALSPQGRPELLSVCRAACAAPPEVTGWTKLAGRPPRKWHRRVVRLRRGGEWAEVDFDRWRFSIDPERPRLVRCFPPAGELESAITEAWHLLDAELGEAFVIEQQLEPVVERGVPSPEAVGPEQLGALLRRTLE